MRYSVLAVILFTAVLCSCRKTSNTADDCFPGKATARQISNKSATIKASGSNFYIVEDFTIDSELVPCNLPADFRVDGLRVIISGDVKESTHAGIYLSDDFVITAISR